MQQRRGYLKADKRLTGGPGSMSKAMGITVENYGEDLQGDLIWIEDSGLSIPDSQIQIGPRIGIDYAEEDAFLPWRFLVNEWWKKDLSD